MRSSRTSLIGKAVLALFLTIGFYGLALGIAGLLLFVIYAQVQFAGRVNLKLTIACLIGAGTILWAVVPRVDHFTAPGPRLEPGEHPHLFDEVRQIAQKIGQKMPAEVYLVSDVNAFVMERGGILGIGSRRVMGVGLPLLQALTIPQFRAVLAHEFGHFHGGDTKLGPWIYKVRMAIVRTIQGLGEQSWLQYPFRWYGMLFLRVTYAISRRQEFVADAIAAHVVGARPLLEGLQALSGVDPAFRAFMQSEVAPVVQAGYCPPLVDGFARFLSASSVRLAMRLSIEQELESSETNPYDTHPALKDRIAALEGLPDSPSVVDNISALALLQHVPELEQRLFAQLLGEGRSQTYKPIDWHSVGTNVWVPFWEKVVQRYASALQGVRLASLPAFLRSPGMLSTQLQQGAEHPMSAAELDRGVSSIVAMALIGTLIRQGWALDAAPGESVSLQRAGHTIQPFLDVVALSSGELAEEVWQERCEQAGVGALCFEF